MLKRWSSWKKDLTLRFGGGRTNLLEELGRVEGERRANPNRRAEISRVQKAKQVNEKKMKKPKEL